MHTARCHAGTFQAQAIPGVSQFPQPHPSLHQSCLQNGVCLSPDDLAKLVSRLATTDSEPSDEDDGVTSKETGKVLVVDYGSLVEWLSQGGGLDDAALAKVQHHLKARLSK